MLHIFCLIYKHITETNMILKHVKLSCRFMEECPKPSMHSQMRVDICIFISITKGNCSRQAILWLLLHPLLTWQGVTGSIPGASNSTYWFSPDGTSMYNTDWNTKLSVVDVAFIYFLNQQDMFWMSFDVENKLKSPLYPVKTHLKTRAYLISLVDCALQILTRFSFNLLRRSFLFFKGIKCEICFSAQTEGRDLRAPALGGVHFTAGVRNTVQHRQQELNT